jgi:hypothetical protein
MGARNWVNLLKDAETGIETLHAHFEGHAYDPHWHDSYLVGFTEHGVQQFDCRGERHLSMPGKVFLLEPGDIPACVSHPAASVAGAAFAGTEQYARGGSVVARRGVDGRAALGRVTACVRGR